MPYIRRGQQNYVEWSSGTVTVYNSWEEGTPSHEGNQVTERSNSMGFPTTADCIPTLYLYDREYVYIFDAPRDDLG